MSFKSIQPFTFRTIIQTTSRDISFLRTRSICGRPESKLLPRRQISLRCKLPSPKACRRQWGATQGTLRLDLNRGQPHERETVGAESSETPSQAALAPYGSDRVNRDPPKRDLRPAARGCNVELLFKRVYPYTLPGGPSTPAPRVRACASLPLTSPETTP